MKKVSSILLITLTLVFVVAFGAHAQGDITNPTKVSMEGYAWIDWMLWFSYILTVVAVIGAVVGPVATSIMSDPKSLVKSAIGLAGILVLFLICYAIAGNEVTDLYKRFNITEGGSKSIGGILITTYVLIFIAAIGIVYTEVGKFFK